MDWPLCPHHLVEHQDIGSPLWSLGEPLAQSQALCRCEVNESPSSCCGILRPACSPTSLHLIQEIQGRADPCCRLLGTDWALSSASKGLQGLDVDLNSCAHCPCARHWGPKCSYLYSSPQGTGTERWRWRVELEGQWVL